jgi:ABC-2 type transport system ATP-binding protein
VVETDDGEIVLTVPSAEIVGLTGRILAAGPVADITISDVPLEDVIAELFGRTDAPAAAVSAPAG